MTTIYGIKNCDTMKKALSWLDQHNISYTFVDYKKTGIAETHLPSWITQVGWETLLNTRGMMWRKLTDSERADVTASKALALMVQYPSLIKRPVLDTGTQLIIGFNAEAYADYFSL